MKTLKKIVLLIIFTIFSFILTGFNTTSTAVSTDQFVGKVQLGGDTIGIQIKTNIEVVGKYEIIVNNEKIKPWENSNINEGDFIYSIDNIIVKTNQELNEVLRCTKKSQIPLVLIRNDKMIETNINVIKNENSNNSIGLYIKDHITGIGTLTFINPETNKYGALGHSVTDALSQGSLYESSIKGVKKAIKGVPGEKYATLSHDKIGTIEINNNIGIFGVYNKKMNSEYINVLKRENITTGKAEIVTVISGNIIKEYAIEIVEVAKQNNVDIKGIKFKVIDQELLSITGGVIQGMSGSPIIQNGCLVGAVSHVLVNDPSIGYGVFAEWMYYNTK